MKTTFSYPKWAEIPNIDLYLDQVLLYVNQVCAPISPDKDKGLTASMVNNYVKHGYLTKPDKKKYQRQQIARLIAITTLKSVFSIQEIAQTLNTLQSQASSDQLYDAFVDYMNQGIDPDMKHTDFYHLSAFPFSLLVSFSCFYHPPFTTLWPMVRPTNMSCESLTIR